MVQCEMCGTETADPNPIKVEGAELDVCDECTDFGTELRTESDSSSSTKYSTSSSSSGSASANSGGSRSTTTSTGTTSGSANSGSRPDMFGDIDDIAQDFDQRIRRARERANLSQQELAGQLNEKASLIRKLEQGDTLPTDELQRKLESYLDIDLSAGGSVDESEWEGDSSTGEYTLGDMVERKD